MGLGDVLMSIGEAKRLHKATGKKVLIMRADGRPVVSDLFNGVPYLMPKPTNACGAYERLVNASGVRPYIAGKTEKQWTWKPFKPTPADVVLTAEEKAFAEPYRGLVLIEPTVKAIGHDNKAWLSIYWQHLVAAKIAPMMQAGPPGTKFLDGVTPVLTPTFRHAIAVMAVAKAFVGTEGGLMHAAAAVGTPAVIIWSEFISPEITGYAHMKNLRKAGKPCGMRLNCESCRQSMVAITSTEVGQALKEILDGTTVSR
jgi:ADP-heptose:LPS heptosyltransferase